VDKLKPPLKKKDFLAVLAWSSGQCMMRSPEKLKIMGEHMKQKIHEYVFISAEVRFLDQEK
jgi:hypothetical protein